MKVVLRSRWLLLALLLLRIGTTLGWSQTQEEGQIRGNSYDQNETVGSESGQDATPPPPNPIPTWSRWSVEPPPESRSYLHAGIVGSESIGSQEGGGSDQDSVSSVSRIAGHVDFLNMTHRFQTAGSYVGGADFTNYHGLYTADLQQLNVTERALWDKGQLTVADSLGDFPGGNFGQAWYGGASAYQLGSTGNPNVTNVTIASFFGLEQFGGFGEGQHITNVVVAEVDQNLTRRSAVTVAGAFAITNFPENPHYLNSTQFSALATYGYQLSRRTSVGLTYGYQSFQYPQRAFGNITVSLAQAYYSYVVSRRLQFSAGGGPEFVSVSNLAEVKPPPPLRGKVQVQVRNTQIDPGVFAAITYGSKVLLGASFGEVITAGSGFYAGSKSSVAELTASRRIKRWQAECAAGYVRLQAIESTSSALPAESYQYGFVGAGVSRSFPHNLGMFLSFQFNDESSLNSTCPTHSSCAALGQRISGVVGVYWQSHPMRLGNRGGNATGSSN